MTCGAPWLHVEPLPDAEFERIRRRAIFDYCKWDPQVEDVCTIARYPLILRRDVWEEVAALACALAREVLRAEAELLARPRLHARLGLGRKLRRALERAADETPAEGVARLIRFDFHYTSAGWRISEANTDVPGGLNEASGLPRLFHAHYPDAAPVGDPAESYVDTLLARAGTEARVLLVYATGYSDDHQVMTYLARLLDARGATPVLASPANLRWHDARAQLHDGAVADSVTRFFPSEWLPDLPSSCAWPRFFAGGVTPISNPATAVLTQSKRFPLIWDELQEPLPTWRALLPRTHDPREVPWERADEWVMKPALGRVGEGVAIPGIVSARDWARLRKEVRRHPEDWVAQQRFDTPPVRVNGEAMYPCIGVYTVGERVVGAYGRLARLPLIDARAVDAAVLVTNEERAA
jgi:glutathionylspermidine synthase